MGSSPTSQLLNQPHLKPDLPRTLHFPESVHFLFNLNQLRSKFSITYIPKNLDSFMGPWQGFCLTQLWGGEGRVWIQCCQPGHPRSLGPLNPLLTLAAPPPLTNYSIFQSLCVESFKAPPPFIPFHVCSHWKLSPQSLRCEQHKKFLAILNSGWQPFTKPANISPLLNQPQMTK